MLRSIDLSKVGRASVGLCLALAACSAAPEDVAPSAELGQGEQALNFSSASQTCSQDPRVQLGIVSQSVCVGAELFFRDDFGGNGRSCASCHPADNNYTIDPAFIAQLPNSDPLFVAELDPDLAGLERPDLMRDHGLILENVDGAEDPEVKFTMRSVPHCLSLATSVSAPAGTVNPPLERTGWSSDGAPGLGRLTDFQTGAIFQHYTQSLDRVAGVDFIQATPGELDAIDDFLRTIGRTNEIDITSGVTLTDSGAEAGRLEFIDPVNRCNNCHRNAGANVAAGFNQNFDTGVERLRLAVLDSQGIPFDGGLGAGTTFNFDANKDGILDSIGNGQFNAAPLIEAADTGPFFHTNAFETIEDAIGFYNSSAFNTSPVTNATNQINMTATEIANIGRFLRVLNASFNVQLAITRINALLPIIVDGQNQTRDLQQELARLALVEVQDALDVLSQKSNLNTAVQANLNTAKTALQTASTQASHTQRKRGAEDALAALIPARDGLGSGMTFTMGPGTVMF
jgi:cytochrome c peroxidase